MARDTKLNIIIDAQDKASKTLGSIGTRLDKMKPALKGIATASTVAFGTLATVVGASVKKFQEQEIAEKRLDQIATQVTGSTKEQIKQFKALASELQKTGVVGDEVIIAGQSQIASFTKNSEVVKELSDDLADLAVAQYGTNVNQDQAIQTANLLGKALQGQLGALTRTGILVNDEFATAFANANTEQERAVILSQIIQDNYGGLNNSLRETSEGGIQALKNSLGDLGEQIGSAVIPILNDLVSRVTPLVEKFTEWAQNNPELVKQIILAVGAITGLLAVVSGISLAMITMNPIVLGVAGVIAGLGWTVMNVVKIAQLFQDEWEYVWAGIKITVAEAVNAIIGLVESMINGIVDAMNSLIRLINRTLEKAKDVPFIGKKFKGGLFDEFDQVELGRIDTNQFAPSRSNTNNIIIQGNTFLGEEDVAEKVGDQIISKLQLSTKT